MTITQIIKEYQSALLEEQHQRDLPNSKFLLASYYAAISETNYWCNLMINHKDWSADLQDKHYVSSPDSIPYPVSC